MMNDWPSNYTYYVDENLNGFIYIKEITNEEEALNWLKEYETKTGTSWTVVRTYPTTGTKILFRKEWKCQFNVRQYVNSGEKGKTTKLRSSKHLACPARINLTVSRVIKKRPRRARAHIHADFPCQLLIHEEHNHPKDSALILRHNRIRNDTKEKLIQLFMTGHSATSAREALKLELYIHYPEDYYMLAADNGNVPSIHAIQGLLKKTVKNINISKEGALMEQHLQILLKRYCEETGGSVKMDRAGDHTFVAICSPLMKRAHSLPQSAEVVFIDASRNLSKQKYQVYMFNMSTCAGNIPLGCIITEVKKKEVFSAALKSLQNCFPENSFFGKKYPVIIMTDHSLNENSPLQEEWSNARFLLCQFKFIKEMWNWLIMPDHHIKNCDRHEMYFAFKRLIHAENPNVLALEYENIKQKYETSYPNFIKYIENVQKYEKLWATCYRKNLSICSFVQSYTDIIFRILKDVVLEKVKAFNLNQLVDFILVRYESYMERHLLDFAYGKYCADLIRKYLPESNNININKIFRSDKDTEVYFVPNETELEMQHIVDIQHGFCTCTKGESRVVCSHISAVIKSVCINEELFKETSYSRIPIFEIATGLKPPQDSLSPFYSLPESLENICDGDLSTDQILVEHKYETNFIQSETQLQTIDNHHRTTENSNTESLTEEETKKLGDFFERILINIEESPTVFVPAVKKLLTNIEKFVKTKSSLRSALYNFGQCRTNASLKTNLKQRHKTETCSFLKYVNRRKRYLGSKWYLQNYSYVGIRKLKNLKDHEYCKGLKLK